MASFSVDNEKGSITSFFLPSPQVNPAVIKSQIAKWENWHATWLSSKTTPTDKKQCLDWLFGVGLASSIEASVDTPPPEPAAVSERIQEDFQGRKVNRYRTIVALGAETVKPASAPPPQPVAMETMDTN